VEDEMGSTEIIGGIEKRRIEICEYDPNWPAEFETHRDHIIRALGSAALQIEHHGSTSVPGLAAKPIIDMLLVVKDSSDEAAYLPHLESAGYILRVREPDWHEHRMLRTPEKDVHLHVFSVGCSEIERHLIFRDHLRENSGDRALYEETKKRLASQDWPSMNDYAEAKTEVITQIMARTQDEIQ
jgi:GrpB-like predicted nucleotidyltransferase (UPF0157 family)